MVCVDLCLWARVLAFVFGCLSLRMDVVLKRLELGRLWALNAGGTDAHLCNDRAGTEAMGPVYTSDLPPAQADVTADHTTDRSMKLPRRSMGIQWTKLLRKKKGPL